MTEYGVWVRPGDKWAHNKCGCSLIKWFTAYNTRVPLGETFGALKKCLFSPQLSKFKWFPLLSIAMLIRRARAALSSGLHTAVHAQDRDAPRTSASSSSSSENTSRSHRLT